MRIFPFSRYTVYGNSMLPALNSSQQVLTFNWVKPKIGDIVVIRKDNLDMIKRVQKISDHKYFVTGDNEKESTDSRSFGSVKLAEIVGKVVLVVR